MQKIIRMVTLVQWAVLAGLIPLIIFLRLFSWWDIKKFYVTLQYNQAQMAAALETLTISQKLVVFSLEGVSTVLLLIAAWNFLKILKLYKTGHYFSKEVIILLKKCNIIILAWAVYEVLLDTLTSITILLFSPEGLRRVIVSVKDSDLLHFFMVLILFLFLQLIQEAYKIKSEQDLVV